LNSSAVIPTTVEVAAQRAERADAAQNSAAVIEWWYRNKRQIAYEEALSASRWPWRRRKQAQERGGWIDTYVDGMLGGPRPWVSNLPLDQHPGERLNRPVLLLGLALVARRSKKAESCRFRNVTPTTNAARNIQYPRRRRLPFQGRIRLNEAESGNGGGSRRTPGLPG
jgi:hypothetical protein